MLVTHRRSPRRLRARRGFTLVELVIVTVLLAIVGGAVVQLLGRQQAFYRGTSDIVELRSQLRQAASMLSSDLRSISSVGGDIIAMTDSSMDFRYSGGSTIICRLGGSGNQYFFAPPLTLTRGNTLTSWVTKPVAADTAYVFDEGSDTTSSTDDVWTGMKINTAGVVDTLGTVCKTTSTDTSIVSNGDAARVAYRVQVTAVPASTIKRGAPVRFVRRAHYSLYKSSNDRNWYLGYCSLVCSSTNTIQPVAGPFLPYASSGSSGIHITYYDVNGSVTATGTSVARISIVLTGQTAGYVNIPGLPRGYYTDSIRVNVAIRNRS